MLNSRTLDNNQIIKIKIQKHKNIYGSFLFLLTGNFSKTATPKYKIF